MTGVTYRYPGLLAKTVTTLDVLSGGRAYLGIGAAWYEREHHGPRRPVPADWRSGSSGWRRRCRSSRQMWSDNDGPYEGRYYQLAETMNHPQVISQPHPPIMIGGSGERKTLRLVAQYADACNLFSSPELAHKLDVLKGHCEAVGRDYAEIERTTILSGCQGGDDAAGMGGLLETVREPGGAGDRSRHPEPAGRRRSGVRRPASVSTSSVRPRRSSQPAAEPATALRSR